MRPSRISKVVLVLASGLALAGLLPVAPNALAVQEATPMPTLPDLAAMTLTPADLPEPEFGLEGGRRVTLDEEAAGVTGYRGQTATPEVAPGLAETLRAAGWQERYVVSLALPAPDDPALVAVRVLSYVTLYGSPEGAAAGFAALEDESAIPTAADVPGSRVIGEESELTRDSGLIAGTEAPYRSLDLTFRTANLTAGVLIFDNLDREPDVATIEALALTLLCRIEMVLAGGGPELGNRAIRLGENVAIDFNDEGYERRAAQTIPYFGESQETRTTREANYGAATDVYSVYQALVLGDGSSSDDPYVVTRLYQFPDEAGATDWLAGLTTRLEQEGAGYVETVAIPDAPTYGDESVTIGYGFLATQTLTTRGTLIAVRVGTVVARLQADALPEPDAAGVRTLVELQVACLSGGSCPARTLAPPELMVPGPSPDLPVPLDPS